MLDESVYNLVPPARILQPRAPMFRSKIPSDLPPSGSTFHAPGSSNPFVSNINGLATGKIVRDRSHAEFGRCPGSYGNEPTNFVKKMSRSYSVPTLAEVKRTNPEQLKPTIVRESKFKGCGGPPKKGDVPVMNLVTSKNFVVANAVEAILAAPNKVQTQAKDYLQKEDYGKVPKYLSSIKKEIATEYEYIRQFQERELAEAGPSTKVMSDEERAELCEGLKAKWESVNTAYQANTHLTVLDTEGKVRNKTWYEAELTQLEADIARMSKKNIQVDLAR